jgi:hypothetical protein
MPLPSPASSSAYRIRSGRPRIRKGHRGAAGLVGAWAWPGGYGQDMVGFAHLSPVGAVTYDGATGLRTIGAGVTYECTVPAGLKLQPPLSILWQGWVPQGGSRTGSAGIFGVSYSSVSSTSPYACYGIGTNGTGAPVGWLNSAGSFSASGAGVFPPAGNLIWACLTISASTTVVYYGSLNGFSTPGSGTGVAAITYGAGSLLNFGSAAGWSRDSNIIHEYGYIFNRELSLAELKWYYSNGRDLYARKRGWAGWTAALAGTAAIKRQAAALLPAI